MPGLASRPVRDKRDRSDGRNFEEFLHGLFDRLGYDLTRTTGDYGADLVIAKDGRRDAVQAKRSSKDVGVKAVQEVVGAQSYYRCQGAFVVTNRGFTPAVRKLERANGVELWDRQALVFKVLSAQRGGGPGSRPRRGPALSGRARLWARCSRAGKTRAAEVGQGTENAITRWR